MAESGAVEQDAELGLMLKGWDDGFRAAVAAHRFIIDRIVEGAGETYLLFHQHLQDRQHDGVVGLVLAHTLGEEAGLVKTPVATTGDSRLEGPVHHLVVLGRDIDLEQDGSIRGALPHLHHQVVLGRIDDVVSPGSLDHGAQNILDVVHELGMVGLDERIRPQGHVGGNLAQLGQAAPP